MFVVLRFSTLPGGLSLWSSSQLKQQRREEWCLDTSGRNNKFFSCLDLFNVSTCSSESVQL